MVGRGYQPRMNEIRLGRLSLPVPTVDIRIFVERKGSLDMPYSTPGHPEFDDLEQLVSRYVDTKIIPWVTLPF